MSILVTQSWLIVGRSLAAARESRVLARINVAHGATQIQPISALLASEAAKYIRSSLKHHSCWRWSRRRRWLRANSPPRAALVEEQPQECSSGGWLVGGPHM